MYRNFPSNDGNNSYQGSGYVTSGYHGSGNQGSSNHGSVDQGSGYQGSGYQGSGYQGSGYQESGYQGSGNQESGYQGSGYQGSGYQGSGYQGSGHQGSGHQGSGHQGSRHQGSGSQGSGYQGSGYQGSGYQGSGQQSIGYQASGYQTSGYQASGYPASGYKAGVPQTSGYKASLPPTSGYKASVPQSSGYKANIPEASGYKTSSIHQASGFKASIPQASGFKASIPQASGYKASIPQASGYKASIPQASGYKASVPQTSGPQATGHQRSANFSQGRGWRSQSFGRGGRGRGRSSDNEDQRETSASGSFQSSWNTPSHVLNQGYSRNMSRRGKWRGPSRSRGIGKGHFGKRDDNQPEREELDPETLLARKIKDSQKKLGEAPRLAIGSNETDELEKAIEDISECNLPQIGTCNELPIPTIQDSHVEDNEMEYETSTHSFVNNPLKFSKNPEVDAQLLSDLLNKENDVQYQTMLNKRIGLPCYKMRGDIVNTIRRSQVVVLTAETGGGKTTQVPQVLLDDSIKRNEGSVCRIACVQSQNIAAVTLAERVAEERAENLGQSVGYQTRFDGAVFPRSEGSILYCTLEVILQWLHSDPQLSSISHIILDGVHERETLSDFLVCVVRDLLPQRCDLKVVLMSATLHANEFSKYFGAPVFHVPGFPHNVKEYYTEEIVQFVSQLQDSNDKWSFVSEELKKSANAELNLHLILALLHHIFKQPPGSVLIFLPGVHHINELVKLIDNDTELGFNRFLVIPFESAMPINKQKEVFNPLPKGVRKIVLATGIAETAITIDDIVYVIDGGRIELAQYDPETDLSPLQMDWVSLAGAKQRRGRAGRVQDGVCFHLYPRGREMQLNSFHSPEVLRTNLETIILQAVKLSSGSSSCKLFMQRFLESPEESVIDISIRTLQKINAVDKDENLTPLGFHLAQLQIDPLIGKLLLMGVIFSCLGPVATIAASLTLKRSPFIVNRITFKPVERMRTKLSEGSKSDHILLLNIFKKWPTCNDKSDPFYNSWKTCINTSILEQIRDLRKQLVNLLKENKFITTEDPDDEALNINSENLALFRAVIASGIYPKVAKMMKTNTKKKRGIFKKFIVPHGDKTKFYPLKAMIHKSVNEKEKNFEHTWLLYGDKIRPDVVYMEDTTLISNYPLLLFGESVEYDDENSVINVDGFVKIKCDKKIADIFQILRNQLMNIFELRMNQPSVIDCWSQDSKEKRFLSLIIDIISNEKELPSVGTQSMN